MLTISRFVHEKGHGLWHSLSRTCIPADEATRAFIRQHRTLMMVPEQWVEVLGATTTSALLAADMLVDTTHDVRTITDVAQQRSQIQGLYLLVSLNCNLDCGYCLYRASEGQALVATHGKRHMDPATAVLGVDCYVTTVAHNHRPEGYWQQITFYGGEPLLNVAAITAAVDRIHEHMDSGTLWDGTELVINTNGVLLTDQMINYLVANNIQVQISIDGFGPVHDRNRSTPAGVGSFEYVIDTLDRLHRAGALVCPMITVTDANISELPGFTLWLCTTYGITQYALSLLMSGTAATADSYPERAAAAMLDSITATATVGATDNGLASLVAGLHQPGPIARPSCGGGRKITVFPSGQLHTCQALESSGISYVSELPTFDTNAATLRDWQARSRFRDNACLDCPALGSCGGGCAAGSYHSNRAIQSIDPHSCRWTRELYALTSE